MKAKVFIGGSRRIGRLPRSVADRLDQLMERGHAVLIGDANGADKAVQKYFAGKEYSDVVVYFVARNCRNNIGDWPTKSVEPGNAKSGFDRYAAKDAMMAEDATCGFMIWDGESRGTLNNMENLLRRGKAVLVYMAEPDAFHTLRDFDELLRLSGENSLESLNRRFRLLDAQTSGDGAALFG